MRGTAVQIVVIAMCTCVFSMRVYSGYKPFVDDLYDVIAEIAQWQLFFTLFAALAIRVNIDGESLDDRRASISLLSSYTSRTRPYTSRTRRGGSKPSTVEVRGPHSAPEGLRPPKREFTSEPARTPVSVEFR